MVYHVLTECQVKRLPINCISILTHYEFKIITYDLLKQLNEELYTLSLSFSDDAYIDGNTKIVAYNHRKSQKRIRFSLMHELAHYILGHVNHSQQNEDEADDFASLILAPRVMIQQLGCKDASDVRKKFDISQAAANRIWTDYKIWRLHPKSEIDYAILKHFTDNPTPFDVPDEKYRVPTENKPVKSEFYTTHELTEEIPDHLPDDIRERIKILRKQREDIHIQLDSINYYLDMNSKRILDMNPSK